MTSDSTNELARRLAELHKDLNPEQQDAALTTEGPVIVVAGAGAGKTKTLIHRVATLIEIGVPPANIMVVTFTNEAAKTIRERLSSMVGELGEHVVAGTFHSIVFNKILKSPYESKYLEEIGIDANNLAIMDDDESNKLFKEAFKALSVEDQEALEELEVGLKDLQKEMSAARSKGEDLDRYQARISRSPTATIIHRITARLWRDYQERCRSMQGIDFDDILVVASRLLDAEPEVAVRLSEEFKYLMLDEYQDTNPVQMMVMDAIAKHHQNIFVVGDEKQSIYGFRSADIEVILSFKKRYPDAKQIDMTRNYRSVPGVISAANACATAMRQKLSDGQLIAMKKEGGDKPVIVEFPTSEAEADIVCKAIARDLRQGVPGKEIAVLYRKRSLKNEIERELIEADLPFELIGDISFYQKAEVKDALALIRFVFRPWDSMGVLRTIRTTSLGLSEKAVKDAIYNRSMTGIGFLKEQSEKRLKAKRQGELGEFTKAAKMIKPLLDLAEAIRESAESGDDADFIKDNLARLWELYIRPGMIKSSKRASNGEGLEGAEAKADNVAFLIERFSKGIEQGKTPDTVLEELSLMAEMVTTKMDRDADQKVKLMTIHAAKGLEFDNVYMIGMDEDALGADNTENPSEVEEARRITYVGSTRAKRKLSMTYSRQRYEHGAIKLVERSSFLTEISRSPEVVNKKFSYVEPDKETPSP